MGRLDNTPQAVREAIAAALMTASVTATAAVLLQQPLFIPGGFVLFLIFYLWRIKPRLREAYADELNQTQQRYADDETYQPILDRFAQDANDDALIEQYRAWKQGPHENEVRLRFLQEAILRMIDAGKIYRVEELMSETERIAEEEGLADRFATFRGECDRRIAAIAQARLESPEDDSQSEQAKAE